MTCEQAMELLSPWLDGELDPQLREALEAHLEACPDCKALADSLRGLDEQLAGLKEPAPESLKRGVLYRIDQASGKAKKPLRRWFGPGTAIGAVAAVLVLLVGLGIIPLKARSSLADAEPAEENYADYVAPDTEAPVDTAATWSRNESKHGFFYAPNGNTAESVPGTEQYELNGEGGMDKATDETKAPVFIIPPAPQTQTGPAKDETDKPGEGIIVAAEPEPEKEPEPEPVTDSLREACARLSTAKNAAVLLYTEFECKSLFAVLETEQPELYALVEELEPEEEGELFVFRTDCGTVLAIHEWLLEQLPRSEDPEGKLEAAETRLRSYLEVLDPGSGSLYRIVSWTSPDHEVAWPEAWPKDWADRVRTGDNWGLFFPSEDYTPNAGKTAYLAFVP